MKIKSLMFYFLLFLIWDFTWLQATPGTDEKCLRYAGNLSEELRTLAALVKLPNAKDRNLRICDTLKTSEGLNGFFVWAKNNNTKFKSLDQELRKDPEAKVPYIEAYQSFMTSEVKELAETSEDLRNANHLFGPSWKEPTPAEKTLLVKAFVLKEGRIPKERAGLEGKLYDYLSDMKPLSGSTQPIKNAKEYAELVRWSTEVAEQSVGAKALAKSLDPETKKENVAAGVEISKQLHKYAKNIKLTPTQLALFEKEDRVKLNEISKKEPHEINAEDRLLLLKAFVLLEGRTPKNPKISKEASAEKGLAIFLALLKPKLRDQNPETHKKAFKDLLSWAEKHSADSPGVLELRNTLRPERKAERAAIEDANKKEYSSYVKSLNLDSKMRLTLGEVESERLQFVAQNPDEITSDDRLLVLKAFVIAEKRVPVGNRRGVEGLLSKLLRTHTQALSRGDEMTETHKELLQWATRHAENYEGARSLAVALDPKTIAKRKVTTLAVPQQFVDYAKQVSLGMAEKVALGENEVLRLASITSADNLTNNDRAVLLKVFVMQQGQTPRRNISGIEGLLAEFLKQIKLAKKSHKKEYYDIYLELSKWARDHQNAKPGIQALNLRLND